MTMLIPIFEIINAIIVSFRYNIRQKFSFDTIIYVFFIKSSFYSRLASKGKSPIANPKTYNTLASNNLKNQYIYLKAIK